MPPLPDALYASAPKERHNRQYATNMKRQLCMSPELDDGEDSFDSHSPSEESSVFTRSFQVLLNVPDKHRSMLPRVRYEGRIPNAPNEEPAPPVPLLVGRHGNYRFSDEDLRFMVLYFAYALNQDSSHLRAEVCAHLAKKVHCPHIFPPLVSI